jgi:hypothetical protein
MITSSGKNIPLAFFIIPALVGGKEKERAFHLATHEVF